MQAIHKTSIETRQITSAPTPHITGTGGTAVGFTAWPRWLSIGAAGLILVGGYVHYCLYRTGYRFIPKIGTSFVLQASTSVMMAVALLALSLRFRSGRHATHAAQL